MRNRPWGLILCSMLFIYFPIEALLEISSGKTVSLLKVIVWLVLPLTLLVALIQVTKWAWYTLIALVLLWGFEDLFRAYSRAGTGWAGWAIHLGIYALGLIYFINPRIRVLYFDPKKRWWNSKPRYETQLPVIMRFAGGWHYPLTKNISEGGCYLESTCPLGVGSELDLAIPLPLPFGLSTIRSKATVRWTAEKEGSSGVGIQFENLGKVEKKALRSLIRAHI